MAAARGSYTMDSAAVGAAPWWVTEGGGGGGGGIPGRLTGAGTVRALACSVPELLGRDP